MSKFWAIIELIKLIVDTWKWAQGKMDDITYKTRTENRKKLVEKATSGSKEERLKNLSKLGQ